MFLIEALRDDAHEKDTIRGAHHVRAFSQKCRFSLKSLRFQSDDKCGMRTEDVGVYKVVVVTMARMATCLRKGLAIG